MGQPTSYMPGHFLYIHHGDLLILHYLRDPQGQITWFNPPCLPSFFLPFYLSLLRLKMKDAE